MSRSHPIISITGSSGAGTTSVKKTFENIFRREKVAAAYIEGDAFHRYNRVDMRTKMSEEGERGNKHFSHFSPETNLFEELERLFRDYGESGTGTTRHYVHDDEEAKLYGAEPGTFTEWGPLPEKSDLLFYEGLHGAVVTDKVNIAQYADLKIGVVPVINLEWIQKLHRDRSDRGYTAGGGDRHHPAADAGLRELHLPAIRRDRHQLPARADGRHLEPVHRAMDPDAGRIDGGDPAEKSARHRFSLSAVDDPEQLHVARQFDRDPRLEARSGDAAHSHPSDPATDGTQEAHGMTVHALLPSPAVPRSRMPKWPMRSVFWPIDAVEKAKSGHPGMPMGMADVATVLFSRFLKFDPADPAWPDRDRFVLSAGHGSMLLYALLHLTGYEGVTSDELQAFRQWGSKTPGHPEYGHTPGVETTTGPLGQGLATAVGMALAERLLNARFGNDFVDHYTYVIAGDGCLMEGLSHEAISLAGHLQAQPADRAVRRQPDFDRWRDVAVLFGRSTGAFQGVGMVGLPDRWP